MPDSATMPAVLREQEERELQPRVLGVGAEDDLGVGDRHVERRAAELGEGRDHEHEEQREERRSTYHIDSCASTMPTIEVTPASITTPAAASTSGSS